jgi:uncharacterized YigZ family protein
MERPEETDSYLTLSSSTSTEVKIQGSRFLGFAKPVSSPDEFMQWLTDLKKEHYNATHHCYAYRLGFGGGAFRYSDDGEPSGTAGKRILGSIDRYGLTDTGVIVVRYFGGTKLGVGGLARAYSESADVALDSVPHRKRFIYRRFELRFPYDATSSVHHDIEAYDAEILDRIYSDDVRYQITLRLSLVEPFMRDIAEHTQRTASMIEIVDEQT